MGLLEVARDRHKGEEIWILGSGPSLGDFPKDFFDDKISIAINWIYCLFPNCTYYFNIHREEAEWIVKNKPECTHKLICGCSLSGKPGRNHMGEYGEKPMYAPWAEGDGTHNGFVASVSNIIRGKACRLADIATTLQPAIQVAAILGAKRITLVGCEARTTRYQLHVKSNSQEVYRGVEGKEYSNAEQRGDTDFFRRCRQGVKWLADLLSPYGIPVRRFYYKTGYEEI